MLSELTWKLLVVTELPDLVLKDFHQHFELVQGSIDEAAKPGFDAVLLSVETRMDAIRIAALAPSLRAIATYSVGTDHIDVAAAAARNIAVFNTPDVLSDAVAEVAMLLLLGAARRVTESIDLIRSGRWSGWTARQLNGSELVGKQLGILGLGSIGRRIAMRAEAFGMRVAYTNRTVAAPQVAGNATFVPDVEDLLRISNALVLACPLTDQTRGFLDARRLAMCQPGIVVVNIGRGDLVMDSALIEALTTGQVGAAGLDVFSGEPRFDRSYLSLPNVFMLPHIGSSTVETRRRMGIALIDSLVKLASWG